MYTEKIGIIGGFGAYASLDFYRRILDGFASECERNYPHIIMDNNFTMPSRTRALLYGEEYDTVVKKIAESLRLMLEQKVDKIVLVCGTAHYFLDDVYEIVPQARKKVIDIIDVLGKGLKAQGCKKVLIIAAEGVLLKEFYPKRLEKYDIFCVNPSEEYYEEIRYFIECVKQNMLDKEAADRFIAFLDRFSVKDVVLGCTEFPVLVNYIRKLEPSDTAQWQGFHFFDPMEMTIQYLKQTLV